MPYTIKIKDWKSFLLHDYMMPSLVISGTFLESLTNICFKGYDTFSTQIFDINDLLNRTISRIVPVSVAGGLAQEFQVVLTVS